MPEDGTYQIGKEAWGSSHIKFNNTDLTERKAEFCVTNQDGEILYPADGKVAVLDATTPQHDITDTVVNVSAGDTINYVLYSKSGVNNSFWAQPMSIYNSTTYTDKFVTNWRDPEVFLKGAEMLGLDPADCCAFEDSQAGIEAARIAGCSVIAIDINGILTDADRYVRCLGDLL